MNLGAALRRSSTRNRVTGLSTAVLLTVAAGSLGAGVAAATPPYPPTAPCALSWSQNSAHRDVLVGSGYDSGKPVAVTLYPQARRLGSYPTNSSGAFAVPLDVPRDEPTSWVTVTSASRSCSVVPPSQSPPTDYPPTVGTSTPPPGGTSGSPGGGTPSGGSTSGSGGPGTGSTGTGSGGSGNGSGGSGSGGSGGSGNGGSGGSNGSGYPPTRTPGAPSSGSTASSTTPGSTTPTRTGTPSPSRTPIDSLKGTSALGLSLTVIVIIAVLLLLAGGLGVLILTRRAG